MLGIFAGGFLAAVLTGLVIFVICCWHSDDKEAAVNRARNDGFNDGYVKGKDYMSDEFKRDAIRLGYAFYHPDRGGFTWKDIDQVRRDTDPVAPISAAKAE